MPTRAHTDPLEMPSTLKYSACGATNAAKFSKTKISIMLMLLVAINLTFAAASSPTSSNQATYSDFLRTETAIIDSLRDYVVQYEEKISEIKRKTLEIKAKHSEALDDVDKYVGNPLNALTILKRFAIDWKVLNEIANKLLDNTEGKHAVEKGFTFNVACVEYLANVLADISKHRNVMTESLKFPTEDDFDEAVGSLLRLQNIYDLQPQRLSLGEVNGIKFGPQMSWSDCLEIGRKSGENGEFKIAKYWIETAMERLPSLKLPANHVSSNNETDSEVFTSNNTHNLELLIKARFEILEELLNAEYHMGNLEKSLEITNEMMLLRPHHKGLLKARTNIENKLKKESKRSRNKRLMKTQKREQPKKEIKKSAEAILIEELCRTSTIAHYSPSLVPSLHKCHLERGNLYELLLEPLKIEILSIDPFVVIQHDVLAAKQIDELKDLIDELPSENDDDEVKLEFTNLAQQKLRRFNEKILQRFTGHASHLFETWQPQRRSFEDENTNPLTDIDRTTTILTAKQEEINAKALLVLQTAKFGGSIVFPQLELSSHMPSGALIYWSNLNEFQEADYRTKHHVCPVIAGIQIVAASAIRRL